jgi:hypothetical protein
MTNVRAEFLHLGKTYRDVAILNPGEWFGKVWLLELDGQTAPIYLVAEADTIDDAIDVLASNEEFGWHIRIEDFELKDYDEQTVCRSKDGVPIDLEWLLVHDLYSCFYVDEKTGQKILSVEYLNFCEISNEK